MELKHAFFKDRDRGYFVEVGANKPHEGSQTFDLEQRGWTGVLIEPQPDLAKDLRRQRSAKVFAVACSSRSNAGKTLTLHLAAGHSSFDPKLNLAEVKPHDAIEVPIRTLDEILIEARAQKVDFFSIDVEGHEIELLDGCDFGQWKPSLILIEDILLHLRLHRLLHSRGYRWLDGRWQFFNKFYLGTPFRRMRFAWRRLTRNPQFVDSC
jgi:FkbM family methyltransferase